MIFFKMATQMATKMVAQLATKTAATDEKGILFVFVAIMIAITIWFFCRWYVYKSA